MSKMAHYNLYKIETEKPVDGAQVRFIHSESMTMAYWQFEPGADLPEHSHPHEQTGYLVKGHMRVSIGSEENDVMPGDSWCIPSGVEHGAEILEDSVAVEVFSPVREDYLPKDRDQE